MEVLNDKNEGELQLMFKYGLSIIRQVELDDKDDK